MKSLIIAATAAASLIASTASDAFHDFLIHSARAYMREVDEGIEGLMAA